MRLLRLLANLGYGSHKEVRWMVLAGRCRRRDGTVLGIDDKVVHDDVFLDGDPLDPPAGAVFILNKPLDFTCSTTDPGRVIYELLPPRFIRRNPVVAPAGRLDRDATGLLLLTDDGTLLHRITSPKRHVPKVYEVGLARSLNGTEAEIFASGTLMLRSEKTPLLPAEMEVLGPQQARLTISEGRYHQVKRMFAALGNHVESLHRSSVGGLQLGDLELGAWRMLDAEEIAKITA